jgi:hypothetical protein
MGITKTVHPPAGATALLAATTPDITELGWFLVPLILLGSSLMIAVACVVNNVQRQFPLYWWTPEDLSSRTRTIEGLDRLGKPRDDKSEKCSVSECDDRREPYISINSVRVLVPDCICLESEEKRVLDVLRQKLEEGLRMTNSEQTA